MSEATHAGETDTALIVIISFKIFINAERSSL